jgi:hypothetical protein
MFGYTLEFRIRLPIRIMIQRSTIYPPASSFEMSCD